MDLSETKSLLTDELASNKRRNILKILFSVVLLGFVFSIVRVWVTYNILFPHEVSKTPFVNCGGSGSMAIVKSFELSPPCQKSSDPETCVINIGDFVSLNVSFVSKIDSNSLQAKMYGYFWPFYSPAIPLPWPQPNGCVDSGITCPIVKNQVYNYSVGTRIQRYGVTRLWVRFELQNLQNEDLICGDIFVVLV